MSLIQAIWLAEIHRETYIAILKSWLPHGERGDFARKIGITREYLSYICAIDHPAEGDYPTKRLPSPRLARKIAEALPAPIEVKQSLLENIELAHVQRARADYRTREFISQRRVSELLTEIGDAHHLATFGREPAEVRQAYRVVRDASANLLPHLSLEINPASYAQACLFLHDAQCVLDRANDALRHALLANLILDNREFDETGFTKEQIDHLEINAMRGIGVAFHNMGLEREAYRQFERATQTAAYRNSHSFWRPIVGRDMINSLVNIPRFGFREAQKLVKDSRNTCERKGDEFTLSLVNESWLRCLIQREKFKRAQRIFREELERIPRLPYIGSLHRALLLKSGARLAWRMGDTISWKSWIQEAYFLMESSGLSHQLRSIREQYGQELESLLGQQGHASRKAGIDPRKGPEV